MNSLSKSIDNIFINNEYDNFTILIIGLTIIFIVLLIFSSGILAVYIIKEVLKFYIYDI